MDFFFSFADLPKFGERLQNITVPVGRDALLICVVDNLQTYKVMHAAHPYIRFIQLDTYYKQTILGTNTKKKKSTKQKSIIFRTFG